MRNTSRARRLITALTALAIIASPGLLSACASVRPGGPAAPQSPASPVTAGQPRAGSRVEALGLARQLLSKLVVPPGAGPSRVSPLPVTLRRPDDPPPGTVDAYRILALPQPMTAGYHFLLKHVPAGMRLLAHGTGSGPTGISSQTVSYIPRSLPAGIYQAELVTVTVPRPGGTALVRADAKVTWFPARSAAEHLDPATFSTVTVSANLFSSGTLRKVSRLVRSPAVITRLARMLNSLPAAPPVTMSCPSVTATYRLSFTVRSGEFEPDTTVTASGCLADQISVDGKVQRPLWDRSGALAAAVRGLLHLSPGS